MNTKLETMDTNKIIRGDYNIPVPVHLNFGRFMLDHLRRMGNETALENGETGEKLTYKEMTEYAVKLSVALTKHGLRKGDIAALGSEKCIMFLPTALAVVLSGAVYAPYDIRSGKVHLKHMLDITKPKYFIGSELFFKTYQEALRSCETLTTVITFDNSSETALSIKSLISAVGEVDVALFEPVTVQGQTDTAIIMYSSGTTGMPKGVQMTHLNCIIYSLPLEPLFNNNSIQAVYVFGEWQESYGIFTTLKFLALGKKIVFSTGEELHTLLTAFERGQVNLAFLVPSFFNLLSKTAPKQNENLNCMKYMFSAGAVMHEKTIKKIKERFPSLIDVHQEYGMTENSALTSTTFSPKGVKLASTGHVCPGVTLKVEDPETKKLLGPNQPGQICMKGPKLMKGYIGVEPSTYLDEEGWFRTGDLGYYDEDGYFYIIDRLKETFNYDGDQVAPVELETILLQHPGVREAGVAGKPVPVFGEVPAAFVVRQPGSDVTEQELIDFVAAEVAPYMELKGGVRFISKMPRNPRGKLLRRQLREMLNEA